MKNIIFALVLLLLSMGGIVVRKTYFRLPVHELKRRARQHDAAARALYRAVAYGNSLRGLLWLYIGLTSAAGLILLARELHIWVSLLVIGPLLWIAFSLMPATRTTRFGTWLTVMVTPPIAWLLNYLHPLLSRSADVVEHRYKAPAHTRLYERDDLIKLIERQQQQPDNRLSQEELEIAKRALSFDDYKVADVMTPRKQVKTALANDTIGPILINELHQSGQEQTLVRESAKGPFVGSLKFSQLGLDSKGKVRDIMHPKVSYVHENDSLAEVLRAFFATNHPVFAVVNSAEEYVGIITVENILHQLIGHLPGDDFDHYANPEAVAARHHRAKKTTTPDFTIEDMDETPVKTDEEVVK
jgi:CBS domain containing-hemolysin-like protein